MPTLSGFMMATLVLSAYCEHSKNPDRKVRVFFRLYFPAPSRKAWGFFVSTCFGAGLSHVITRDASSQSSVAPCHALRFVGLP